MIFWCKKLWKNFGILSFGWFPDIWLLCVNV